MCVRAALACGACVWARRRRSRLFQPSSPNPYSFSSPQAAARRTIAYTEEEQMLWAMRDSARMAEDAAISPRQVREAQNHQLGYRRAPAAAQLAAPACGETAACLALALRGSA